MIKSNFREWTLDTVDEAFQLKQVRTLPILDELLAYQYEFDEIEKTVLLRYQDDFTTLGGDDWNEVELKNKIISPIIVLSGIQNKEFSYFLERSLAATINDYELSGYVDGMFATGFRNPKKTLLLYE